MKGIGGNIKADFQVFKSTTNEMDFVDGGSAV